MYNNENNHSHNFVDVTDHAEPLPADWWPEMGDTPFADDDDDDFDADESAC